MTPSERITSLFLQSDCCILVFCNHQAHFLHRLRQPDPRDRQLNGGTGISNHLVQHLCQNHQKRKFSFLPPVRALKKTLFEPSDKVLRRVCLLIFASPISCDSGELLFGWFCLDSPRVLESVLHAEQYARFRFLFSPFLRSWGLRRLRRCSELAARLPLMRRENVTARIHVGPLERS